MGEILGVHHLCVRTADMARSLEFYRGVLGFSLVSRETCGFGEYAMLRLRSSRIELIQPLAPDVSSFGCSGALAHFGLEVRRIDEVVGDLKSKGVRFESDGPVFNEHPLGGFRSISFKGPSGEAINLYEFI